MQSPIASASPRAPSPAPLPTPPGSPHRSESESGSAPSSPPSWVTEAGDAGPVRPAEEDAFYAELTNAWGAGTLSRAALGDFHTTRNTALYATPQQCARASVIADWLFMELIPRAAACPKRVAEAWGLVMPDEASGVVDARHWHAALVAALPACEREAAIRLFPGNIGHCMVSCNDFWMGLPPTLPLFATRVLSIGRAFGGIRYYDARFIHLVEVAGTAIVREIVRAGDPYSALLSVVPLLRENTVWVAENGPAWDKLRASGLAAPKRAGEPNSAPSTKRQRTN